MKRIIALLLSLLLCTSICGCAARSMEPITETPPPVEEATPQETPVAPIPEAVTEPEEIPAPEELPEEVENILERPFEPANPAAVTEFSAYSSLSGEKLGWGPGGPVDELNRSQGALSYQNK